MNFVLFIIFAIFVVREDRVGSLPIRKWFLQFPLPLFSQNCILKHCRIMSYKINETSEIWKDIKGYEGIYQVSNLGRVKSLGRHEVVTGNPRMKERARKEKLLTPQPNHKGYLCVVLMRDRKKIFTSVHRLVANAFIPNPNNLPQVNHKDENKTNNRAENLEWCTSYYNLTYGTAIERTHQKQRIQVAQVDTEGNIIRIYNSAKEAYRITGISDGNINQVCKGRRIQAGGYKWKQLK